MKNLVLASVAALVLTGAAVSTHTSPSNGKVVANVSAMPVPMCPPGDPNGCGIYQPR